jgi:hypothetical protein
MANPPVATPFKRPDRHAVQGLNCREQRLLLLVVALGFGSKEVAPFVRTGFQVS